MTVKRLFTTWVADKKLGDFTLSLCRIFATQQQQAHLLGGRAMYACTSYFGHKHELWGGKGTEIEHHDILFGAQKGYSALKSSRMSIYRARSFVECYSTNSTEAITLIHIIDQTT